MATISGVNQNHTPNEGRVLWNDSQEAINTQLEAHVDDPSDVHDIGDGNNVVGTGTSQTLTNKIIHYNNNNITIETADIYDTLLTFTTEDNDVEIDAGQEITISGTNGIAVLGVDEDDSLSVGLKETLVINEDNQTVAIKTTAVGANEAVRIGGKTRILDDLEIYNNDSTKMSVGASSSDEISITHDTIDSNTDLKITADSNISIDTDTIYVNISQDRVGINTTTPGTELDVKGTAWVGDDSNRMEFTGASAQNSINSTGSEVLDINSSTTLNLQIGEDDKFILTASDSTLNTDLSVSGYIEASSYISSDYFISSGNELRFTDDGAAAYINYPEDANAKVQMLFGISGDVFKLNTGDGNSAPNTAITVDSSKNVEINGTFTADDLAGTLSDVESFYDRFGSGWDTYSADEITITEGPGNVRVLTDKDIYPNGSNLVTYSDLPADEVIVFNEEDDTEFTLYGDDSTTTFGNVNQIGDDAAAGEGANINYVLHDNVYVEKQVVTDTLRIGGTSVTWADGFADIAYGIAVHNKSLSIREGNIFLGESSGAASTANTSPNNHQLRFYGPPSGEDTNSATFCWADDHGNLNASQAEFRLYLEGTNSPDNGFVIRRNPDNGYYPANIAKFRWNASNNIGQLQINDPLLDYDPSGSDIALAVAGDVYLNGSTEITSNTTIGGYLNTNDIYVQNSLSSDESKSIYFNSGSGAPLEKQCRIKAYNAYDSNESITIRTTDNNAITKKYYMHADEFIIPNQASAKKFASIYWENTGSYGFFGQGAYWVKKSYSTTSGEYTVGLFHSKTSNDTFQGKGSLGSYNFGDWYYYTDLSWSDIIGDTTLPWNNNFPGSFLESFKITGYIYVKEGEDGWYSDTIAQPPVWFYLDYDDEVTQHATNTNKIRIMADSHVASPPGQYRIGYEAIFKRMS